MFQDCCGLESPRSGRSGKLFIFLLAPYNIRHVKSC